MAYANTVKAYPFGNEYMQLSGGKHAMLSEEKLDQFQKIYDLCDRNGIRLVLLTVPSANTWNKGKSDTVKQLAKKYDLTYYDYKPSAPSRFQLGHRFERWRQSSELCRSFCCDKRSGEKADRRSDHESDFPDQETETAVEEGLRAFS